MRRRIQGRRTPLERPLAAAAAAAAAWIALAAPVYAEQRATADGMTVLNETTWQPTLSQGAWVVEFFETRPKSLDFFPTWEQLLKNEEHLASDYPDAPLHFAQVDCHASSELCQREGVDATPRLFTYWDGKKSEGQYMGDRTYADLAAYVGQQAQAYRTSKGVSDDPHPVKPPTASPSTPAAGANATETPEKAPAPPPPPAAEEAPGPDGPNSAGKLIHFGKAPIEDEEALAKFIGKGSGAGPSFVRFAASWCPHCKSMRPAWEQLAGTLKNKINLIEVECVEHKETCRKYNIQSFPTLRMYNDGQVTEYRGGRSHNAMRDWALKAGSSKGLREIKAADLERIRKDNEVFFLYLYSPGTPQAEQDLVEKASTVLRSKQTFAFRSSDAALRERYSSYLRVATGGSKASEGALSGLLVFKDHAAAAPVDRFYPATLGDLTAPSAVTRVADWYKAQQFPSVVELTGTTFSDVVYNDAKALVVLAVVSDIYHGGNVIGTGSGTAERDLELKLFRETALQWRNSPRPLVKEQLIWAWIDADRWATAVKTYYKIRAVDVPRMVLVDGARLQYYDLPGDSAAAANGQPWLDAGQVFDSLEAISQGQVKPKSSQTVIDRSMHVAGGLMASLVEAAILHPFLFIVFFALLAFLFIRALSRPRRQYDPLLPTSGKLD